MSCSGSLKKGRFGYQWQAALALVGPIYDTSVESTIFAGKYQTLAFFEGLLSSDVLIFIVKVNLSVLYQAVYLSR